MTKTKLSIAALTALLAMGSLNTISAAETDYTKGESDVEFTLNKGSVVDPGIPTDPEFPTDPTDPHPGADTDFRIWYIPSAFVFENGILSSESGSYAMKDGRDTRVAVADLRDSRDGWNLGATLSDLVNVTTDNPIVGATISWVQEASEVIDTEFGTFGETDVDAPQLIYIDKETTSIMKADAGKGFGYHVSVMSNVRLNIPKKQGESGDYKGTVNWTLSKTPTVQE